MSKKTNSKCIFKQELDDYFNDKSVRLRVNRSPEEISNMKEALQGAVFMKILATEARKLERNRPKGNKHQEALEKIIRDLSLEVSSLDDRGAGNDLYEMARRIEKTVRSLRKLQKLL
ncbi:MAG TPA: hypothetical protein P5056_01840 [Candidatus Paceibacterota bacterium]|nr:hypothetical protein [Candidatus Paceibacterota bacterium]